MIKNIIFDFGGVIYDIDHSLSKKAFEELGVRDFDHLYGHRKQVELFEKMERGELSEQQFRQSLRQYVPQHTIDADIDRAWSALLLGFDTKRIDLLEEIGKNYHLFLLSNTNNIHARQFLEEINAYKDFRSLFVDVWFSHEKGMRKPETVFYQSLLQKHQLLPRECLFIDDLDVNILAAQRLGIHTHYLQGHETILDLFNGGEIINSLILNSASSDK